MKSRRVGILVAAVVLLVSDSPVMALTQFKDGGVWNIDYEINDDVWVDYQSPGMGTTVNMLDGGSIPWVNPVPPIYYQLKSFEDSIINILGGSVDILRAYDSSQVTVSGGSIKYFLYLHDSSQVTVSGGSFENTLIAYDNSQVTVSGGSVRGLYAFGGNQVTVSGGSIGNLTTTSQVTTVSGGSIKRDLKAYGSSQVILSGGLIGRELLIWSNAVLTIDGSDFAVDETPVGSTELTSILGLGYENEPYRRLTGTLLSGDPLNNDFRIGHSAKIVLTNTGPQLPPNEDIDGDGLLNGWEVNGYDVNGDGTIDLDLPALGADPMHKDLFVEVDAMAGRAPTQAALDRVVAAFAAVPNSFVDNPDGKDGITLHIQLDETNIPLADWPNAFGDFDNVKDNRFGTPAQRDHSNWSNIRDAKAKVYRYCIFANTHSGGRSSGFGERPGNDFMVTLGEWPTPGGTEDEQVGTFMHEFGHNLNLQHGGNDDINYKPNYHSIMNYHWQTPHWNHTGWELDYSREVLSALNESNLDENAGIGAAAGVTVPVGPLPVVVVNESGPIDWNRNNISDTSVSADINYVRTQGVGGPSPGQVFTGHSDWPVLWYRLSGHSNFQDGVHIDIPEEMTYEMYREVYGPRINARLDFEPDTFNLGSQGQFVTTYIELPQGFNVSNIDISSLMLNISVPALSTPIEIGDYDSDGTTDLMVKFDRQEVIEILEPGEQLVYLTGRLSDGTSLTGDEIIWVLPSKGEK